MEGSRFGSSTSASRSASRSSSSTFPRTPGGRQPWQLLCVSSSSKCIWWSASRWKEGMAWSSSCSSLTSWTASLRFSLAYRRTPWGNRHGSRLGEDMLAALFTSRVSATPWRTGLGHCGVVA
nr:unnamed protein product [Digitaria exilis]